MFAHFLFGVLAARLFLASQRSIPRSDRASSRIPLLVDAAILSLVALLCLEVVPNYWGRLPGVWRIGNCLRLARVPALQYAWPLFPAGIMLLLVLLPLSRIAHRLIDNRFMRWTATLSYGIYIWHLPVLLGVKTHWPTPVNQSWFSVSMYVTASLVACYSVAAISYHLLELPILRWGNRVSSRRPT